MTASKSKKVAPATVSNGEVESAARMDHLDRMTNIVDELTYWTSDVRDILLMSVHLIEEHGGNHDLCVGACKALDVLRRQMENNRDLVGDLEVGLREPFARLVALEVQHAD